MNALNGFPSVNSSVWGWLAKPYTVIVLTALSAWLLDGFNIGPINDGWINLGLKEHGFLFRSIEGGRIFGSLPAALGLRIVDDGFQGWQGALFLLTCLRGVLFYEIVRRVLPAQPLFALACGTVALFNPVDSSWFWLDATGAHFGFVMALAASLASLIYLQGGAHSWLAAIWLLQAAASLTYTAYLPLMAALPTGAWLLRRVAGAKGGQWRLLGCLAMVVVFLFIHFLMVTHGTGREGRVADLSPHAALRGYMHETVLFLHQVLGFFSGFKLEYLPFTVLPGLLACGVALHTMAEAPGGTARPSWRFHIAMVAGLIVLAVVSYFPYAISDVRFGQKRQLMAAGIFLYTALLYILLVIVPRRLPQPTLAVAFGFFAALIVCTGLTKRHSFVEAYRAQERLLAGIAAAVPHPLPSTTILVWLRRPSHIDHLGGFYSRWGAFSSGLQVMYSDDSLRAGFIPPRGMRKLEFGPEGLNIKGSRHRHAAMFVPYDRLLLLRYSSDDHITLLLRDWLQRQVPPGTDVSGYAPERHQAPPGDNAVVCTMLERDMRPRYCEVGDAD